MKRVLLLFLLIGGYSLQAQNLVYTPKNPAFGGDTFNYQWLLSSAEAQNSFEDPESSLRDDRTEMEKFTESLNSQLLGQMSRRMFSNQFGEEGLAPGTYTFGSLGIDIYPSNEGLVINILDTNTGEQTQIVIPN